MTATYFRQVLLLLAILCFFLGNATFEAGLQKELDELLAAPSRRVLGEEGEEIFEEVRELDILIWAYAQTEEECEEQLKEDCEMIHGFKNDPCSETSNSFFLPSPNVGEDGMCTIQIYGHWDADNIQGLIDVEMLDRVDVIGFDHEVELTGASDFKTGCTTQSKDIPWGLKAVNDYRSPKQKPDEFLAFDPKAGEGVTVFILDSGLCPGCENWKELKGSHGPVEKIWTQGYDNGHDDHLVDHGSHVMGTAVGQTYGIARGAKAVSVKILGYNEGNEWEQFWRSGQWLRNYKANMAGAIWGLLKVFLRCKSRHATEKMCVINASIEARYNAKMNEAFNLVARWGIPIIVSAGNNDEHTKNVSPASAKEVIVVGATDQNYKRANFKNEGQKSNYGDVDIWAPGVDIKSIAANGARVLEGTSQAAPHVTGVVAAIMSKLGKEHLRKSFVMDILKAAGKSIVSDNRSKSSLFLQNPVRCACGFIPKPCHSDFNWAMEKGRFLPNAKELYPGLEDEANGNDIAHIFHCENIRANRCNHAGLLPACDANGQARVCSVNSSIRKHPSVENLVVAPEPLTQEDALAFCAFKGGYPVVPTSDFEIDAIRAVLSPKMKKVWLGLYKENEKWVRFDGKALDWTNWKKRPDGKPLEGNQGESHAGIIFNIKKGWNGHWFDLNTVGERKLYTVCEIVDVGFDLKGCVEVLSVDSEQGQDGSIFNFDKDTFVSVFGKINGPQRVLHFRNRKFLEQQQIVVKGAAVQASEGNVRGEAFPNAEPGDWQAGDQLCTKEEQGQACGFVPQTCERDLDWAFKWGQHKAHAPNWYPSLDSISGKPYGQATRRHIQQAFFCDGIQKERCNDKGLQPLCDGQGKPMAC